MTLLFLYNAEVIYAVQSRHLRNKTLSGYVIRKFSTVFNLFLLKFRFHFVFGYVHQFFMPVILNNKQKVNPLHKRYQTWALIFFGKLYYLHFCNRQWRTESAFNFHIFKLSTIGRIFQLLTCQQLKFNMITKTIYFQKWHPNVNLHIKWHFPNFFRLAAIHTRTPCQPFREGVKKKYWVKRLAVWPWHLTTWSEIQ